MDTMQNIARALLKLKKMNYLSYHRMMHELNRAIMQEVLTEHEGNCTKASAYLGVTRATFAKYIDMPIKKWKEENL